MKIVFGELQRVEREMNMSNGHTAFCIECGCKTHYRVSSSVEKITVRGVTFSYTELRADCEDCGNEVYAAEISDENVLSREEGYRREAGAR